MPELKASQLRELTLQELEEKLAALRAELLQLRFQAHGGNLEKPSRIKLVRRSIARILTIIKEKKDATKAAAK